MDAFHKIRFWIFQFHWQCVSLSIWWYYTTNNLEFLCLSVLGSFCYDRTRLKKWYMNAFARLVLSHTGDVYLPTEKLKDISYVQSVFGSALYELPAIFVDDNFLFHFHFNIISVFFEI